MKTLIHSFLLLAIGLVFMACPPKRGELVGLNIDKKSSLKAINAASSDLYFIENYHFSNPTIRIDLRGSIGTDADVQLLWTDEIQNGQATARIILNKGTIKVKETERPFFFDLKQFLSQIPEGTPIYLLDDEIVIKPLSK